VDPGLGDLGPARLGPARRGLVGGGSGQAHQVRLAAATRLAAWSLASQKLARIGHSIVRLRSALRSTARRQLVRAAGLASSAVPMPQAATALAGPAADPTSGSW